jgi:hypothetical protein
MVSRESCSGPVCAALAEADGDADEAGDEDAAPGIGNGRTGARGSTAGGRLGVAVFACDAAGLVPGGGLSGTQPSNSRPATTPVLAFAASGVGVLPMT